MSALPFGQAHLEYPDLFPARRGGETWGEDSVVLRLPGGPYAFSGLAAHQSEIICRRFDGLVAPHEQASVSVSVFRAAPSDFREIDRRGWEYSLDFDYEPAVVRLAGLELMGRIEWCPELTGALWCSASDAEVFYGAFENFFRVLLSYRLLECGGALIHSAGVVDEEGAFIFPGRSGAGKSTLSRLSMEAGRTLLSDDLNAVRAKDGESWVDEVPFTGDFKPAAHASRSYSLRAICRLEKGKMNAVRPASPAETLALLFTCSPNLNVDPHRRDALIQNLEAVVRSVPSYNLTFSLAGGLWDVLRERSR